MFFVSIHFCSHIGLVELVPLILTLRNVKISIRSIFSLQQTRMPCCNQTSAEQYWIYKNVELIIAKLLYITAFFICFPFQRREILNTEKKCRSGRAFCFCKITINLKLFSIYCNLLSDQRKNVLIFHCIFFPGKSGDYYY